MGLFDYLPHSLQNQFITEGHNRYGSGHEVPPPKGGSSERLSVKHHEESIAFDRAHAREHDADAKKHEKALVKLKKKGNKR